MKKTLTVEQSAKLIELGVPKERASEVGATTKIGSSILITHSGPQPIFTIADLLTILPKTIEIRGEIYEVNFLYSRHQYWKVYYSPHMGMDVLYNIEKELIDALWNLLADLIEGNYVKPQEL